MTTLCFNGLGTAPIAVIDRGVLVPFKVAKT
jgi:hypothetical protein